MPFVIMKCLNCNNDFIGGDFPSRITKYCSRKCMSFAYRNSIRYLNCLNCNEVFVAKTKKSKFCSPRCIKYIGPKDRLGSTKGKGFWQTATETQKKEKIKNEFERLVIKKEGCWGWKTIPIGNGYGKINIGKRKLLLAHRASWMIHFGDIPEGYYICHKCDNPICTNPGHLFLGTPRDNSQDCSIKKRKNSPSGINHYNVKLTEFQVIEIKKLIQLKYSQHKIANMYKVSPSTIQNIVDGRTWKSVFQTSIILK